MAETLALDPEFEAVLQEVAARPNSILLKVPRPRMVRRLMTSRSVISPLSSGFSHAERELATVWRSEIAWLLREACVWELIHSSREGAVYSPFRTPDSRRVPLDAAGIGSRLPALERGQAAPRGEEVSRGTPDGSSARAHRGIALLHRAVSGDDALRPSVAEMATVSHMIEPSQEGRILAAIDFLRGALPWTALRVIQGLFHEPMPDSRRTQLWQCGAVARAHGGDLPGAFDAAQRACRTRGRSFLDDMNVLVFAISLGDDRAAKHAASRLDGELPADHAAVDRTVWHLSGLRANGRWQPPSTGVELARRRQDQLGPVGWRIANAFL